MQNNVSTPTTDEAIRYEPDDPCPLLVALGVGLQGITLVLGDDRADCGRHSSSW